MKHIKKLFNSWEIQAAIMAAWENPINVLQYTLKIVIIMPYTPYQVHPSTVSSDSPADFPNYIQETLAAMAEAQNISKDSDIEGYTSMEALIAALETEAWSPLPNSLFSTKKIAAGNTSSCCQRRYFYLDHPLLLYVL